MPTPAVTRQSQIEAVNTLLPALAYADLRVRWGVARAQHGGFDPDDEFRGLYISDAHLEQLLGYELGESLWGRNGYQPLEAWRPAVEEARRRWRTGDQADPFLRLQRRFDLPDVAVDALLLTLLPEIEPRYERIFAYLQDDVTQKRPTVDLLLNLLTESFAEKLALRRLFAPGGPLVAPPLVACFAPSTAVEPTLLSHFARPAPSLVGWLLGETLLDSALDGCTSLTVPAPVTGAARFDALLDGLNATPPPLYALSGEYGSGKQAAAATLAVALDAPLLAFDCAAAAQVGSTADLLRLAIRDARLHGAVLYLAHWETVLEDGRPPALLFDRLLAYPGVVVTGSSDPWVTAGDRTRRILAHAFDRPEFDERHRVWRQALADAATLEVDDVANHFRFTPGEIRDAVATARDLAAHDGGALSSDHLFAASRAHSNQRLGELATKIVPRFHWDDIILPQDTLAQLREMVNTVRNRPTVYREWGFGRKLALGRGLNALFAGESGTGKTMAADILANELGLDLYKIDLSTVVSKYIGETEKNLGRIFQEAETSNAVLFFDEADALFGKRSEVKDSHDRYANIETGYLLQRMEAFDGIVILATNLRANLDEAFTRRLHFIVEFPFPEPADRERIWRVNVPHETPLAPDVDFHVLAHRLRIAGGNIRNIIVAAAFLAAEAGTPVGRHHIYHAARREYQKLGRLIDERLFTP